MLGVPVQSVIVLCVDSLLHRADAGRYPVATLAIGKAGAINAALLAASILGHQHPQFHERLKKSATSRPKPCWTTRTRVPDRGPDEDR